MRLLVDTAHAAEEGGPVILDQNHQAFALLRHPGVAAASETAFRLKKGGLVEWPIWRSSMKSGQVREGQWKALLEQATDTNQKARLWKVLTTRLALWGPSTSRCSPSPRGCKPLASGGPFSLSHLP